MERASPKSAPVLRPKAKRAKEKGAATKNSIVARELSRLVSYKLFQIELLKKSAKASSYGTLHRLNKSLEKENKYAHDCRGGAIETTSEKSLYAYYRLLTRRFHELMDAEKKNLSEMIKTEELKKKFTLHFPGG